MSRNASTRFLVPIVAMAALALLIILPRWVSPSLVDTCRNPQRFADITRVPGSAADYQHEVPDRALRLQDLAGEFDNPALPEHPGRFRVMRDYAASALARRPTARVESEFEPETAKSHFVTIGDRESEIALVTGPRMDFVQVGAYSFVAGSQAVANPTGSLLRQAFTDFSMARRPTTLIVAYGLAPRSRTDLLEARLIEWVSGALLHHQESCEGGASDRP